MSLDSRVQLCQAQYDCELSDWHPITMVLLWRVLIALSLGHIASLLLVQLTLLWVSIFLISIVLYRRTSSRKISLYPFAVALSPFVFNISGVIWKDVQMAYAILLSVALVLYIRQAPQKIKRYKNVVLAATLVLLAYATSVRTNAVAATLPVICWVFLESGWVKSKSRLLGLTGLFLLLTFISLNLLNLSFHAVKGNTPGVMMSTDVANTLTKQEIRSKEMSPDLKDALSSLSDCSRFTKDLDLKYWHCASAEKRIVFTTSRYKELRSVWLAAIKQHPGLFVGYKLEAFSKFLWADDNQPIWQPGLVSGSSSESVQTASSIPVAPPVKSVSAVGILHNYVIDFGYRYFPFLFKAWFWVVAGMAVLYYRVRRGEYERVVIALVVSSLLNILSYLPVAGTNDYRYIYWSAIATSFAILLNLLSRDKNILKKSK